MRTLARIVAADVGDPADRLQSWEVDLLEDDAPLLQDRNRRLDVIDLPAHPRERPLRRSGRLEESELAVRAAVEEATGSLVGRFEAELLRVEPACPLEVLCGQSRRHTTISKHASPFVVIFMRRRVWGSEIIDLAADETPPCSRSSQKHLVTGVPSCLAGSPSARVEASVG